jgi:hypothetical protein
MVPASRDCQWSISIQVTGRRLYRDEEDDSHEIVFSDTVKEFKPVISFDYDNRLFILNPKKFYRALKKFKCVIAPYFTHTPEKAIDNLELIIDNFPQVSYLVVVDLISGD